MINEKFENNKILFNEYITNKSTYAKINYVKNSR